MYSDVNTFCLTGLSDCVLALGFEKMSRGSLKNTVSIIKCLRHTIFMITLCFIIIALMH